MNIWDNQNRIDPGQTGGPPNIWSEIHQNPYQLGSDTAQYVQGKANEGLDSVVGRLQGADFPYDIPSGLGSLDRGDIAGAGMWAGGMPFYEIPNFTNLDRGQRVTGWGADPQEKSAIARQMADAMTGALGNDPAMIRMGGKEFPNAFLHRTIGNPAELDWWGNLFQKGMSSQKPTSAVTPSVLQTFKSEPYGLIFNVNEPNQLKHAAAADVYSEPTRVFTPQMQAKWDNLVSASHKSTNIKNTLHGEIADEMASDLGGVLSSPVSDILLGNDTKIKNALSWLPPSSFIVGDTTSTDYIKRGLNALNHPDDILGAFDVLARELGIPTNKNYGLNRLYKYADAKETLRQKMRNMTLGKESPEAWEPSRRSWSWLHPEEQGLDELFSMQMNAAKDRAATSNKNLWHSELIPEIDRSMLAGVRLPFEQLHGYEGKTYPSMTKIMDATGDWVNPSDSQSVLLMKLRDFAEQMGVPIFRWPAVETRAQQIKGLENPFEGNWGRPPRKDYTTSSELTKIFGITELP